jgi:hypothetical protein
MRATCSAMRGSGRWAAAGLVFLGALFVLLGASGGTLAWVQFGNELHVGGYTLFGWADPRNEQSNVRPGLHLGGGGLPVTLRMGPYVWLIERD